MRGIQRRKKWPGVHRLRGRNGWRDGFLMVLALSTLASETSIQFPYLLLSFEILDLSLGRTMKIT